QFPPVRAGQPAVLAGSGIPPGQVEPCPDGRRRRVTLVRQLTGRPVRALAQLNDLCLVLPPQTNGDAGGCSPGRSHARSTAVDRWRRLAGALGRPHQGPTAVDSPRGRPQTSVLAPARPGAARQPAAARYRRAATAPGRPQGSAPCARSARRAQLVAPAKATPGAGTPAPSRRTGRPPAGR